MPNRIKIFLGFLALIALFSVYNVFNSLSKKSVFFAIIGTESPLPNPETDTDHDGLTNREESYWNTDFQNPDTDGDGFLDGEEVASGHDPLKPGPDDLLPAAINIHSDINITDKLSGLIISGIAAGDLGPNADKNTYNNAASNLSLAIIDDGIKTLNVTYQDIESNKINASTDSKESQQKYLNEVSMIVENDLWEKLLVEPYMFPVVFKNFDPNNPRGNIEVKNYFSIRAAYFQKTIEKINSLKVPPSWTDIHKKLLGFLMNIELNYQAIASIDDDPIKSLVAINNLESSFMDTRPLLADLVQKTKNKGLIPPNGKLWNLINSLTNGL